MVLDPAEYQEQLEFASRVVALLPGLPERPERARLIADAESVEKLVRAKGAGAQVAAATADLRWALIEATMHALKHPAYAERYQRTKKRLGRQRGAKVAQVDIARRLCHAIWHMLTRNQSFAPRGAAFRLAA